MILKPILERLYPLHRTLVSDGFDQALEIVREYIPLDIEEYACGSQAWTWMIPPRYRVLEAYLADQLGNTIVDWLDTPLAVVSYSPSVDAWLTLDELRPHLHVAEGGIPWVYKYYERDWGFCITKDQYDDLNPHGRFHAVIRSQYLSRPGMHVGTLKLGRRKEEIVVLAHLDHPAQANDDASGVVTAMEVANRLIKKPLPEDALSVRFLFGPETIGSIAYFARHGVLDEMGGIFCEMTGTYGGLNITQTRHGNMLLDRVAKYVIPYARLQAHGSEPANDEKVLESVGIPCISVHRWPYAQYHTSADNPEIICESRLQEAADAVEEMVRIYATNYIPRREYRGPLFLSGCGMFDRANEKIASHANGDFLLDIARETGINYWDVRARTEAFVQKGLMSRA